MHLMLSLTRNVASSANIMKWHVQFDILFYLFYYFSSVIALNGLIEFEVIAYECRWDKLLSQKNTWSSCKHVKGLSWSHCCLHSHSLALSLPHISHLCLTSLFSPNLHFTTPSQWNIGPSSNQCLFCLACSGATAWWCSCVSAELVGRYRDESSLAPLVCS